MWVRSPSETDDSNVAPSMGTSRTRAQSLHSNADAAGPCPGPCVSPETTGQEEILAAPHVQAALQVRTRLRRRDKGTFFGNSSLAIRKVLRLLAVSKNAVYIGRTCYEDPCASVAGHRPYEAWHRSNECGRVSCVADSLLTAVWVSRVGNGSVVLRVSSRSSKANSNATTRCHHGLIGEDHGASHRNTRHATYHRPCCCKPGPFMYVRGFFPVRGKYGARGGASCGLLCWKAPRTVRSVAGCRLPVVGS